VPAVFVGAALFVVATLVAVALVARRPDRRTMLVGLAVIALAFFVLPTRVHERYLYPLVGLGAILAAVSLRWRVAYVFSAAATFANMYAVLTSLGYDTPHITDWLGIGAALTSWAGVALASIAQVVVFAWTFAQLRGDRLDELAQEIEAGRSLPPAVLGPSEPVPVLGSGPAFGESPPPPGQREARWPSPPTAPLGAAAAAPTASAAAAPTAPAGAAVAVPTWDDHADTSLGLWAWFRERFSARAVRTDRSRALDA